MLLFDTERSVFVLFCDAERARLLFLAGSFSPEDFVKDLQRASLLRFAPEVDVSVMGWGKSKCVGLAVDFKALVSLTAILEVGSRRSELSILSI